MIYLAVLKAVLHSLLNLRHSLSSQVRINVEAGREDILALNRWRAIEVGKPYYLLTPSPNPRPQHRGLLAGGQGEEV